LTEKYVRKIENLSRLMVYVLGVSPDEFGLVPDREGYVDIKTFLQALHEEPNMGYVREYHVKEVLLSDRNNNFYMEGKKIRYAKNNFHVINENRDKVVTPKILFKGVKRKAYPHILKFGLLPGSDDYVSMAKDKDFAIRIAKRIDQKPVLLEIKAGSAMNNGITIRPFGAYLFLAENVPAEFIQGPPLPKETFKEKTPPKKEMDKSPGTFTLKIEKDLDLERRTKAKKRFTWKEEAKKSRKKKRNHIEQDWEGLF
jgi:putative RNA 2'-phosphotransferase